MANIAIPNLPPVIALSGAEQFEVVQGGTSSRATVSQIGAYLSEAAAGSNGQVQYNNMGLLGASPNFTFDGTNLVVAGIATAGTVSTTNAQITGGAISGVALTLDSLDNTPIGATTPSTGAFTTVTTTNAQITGGAISGVALTLDSLDNTPIGATTPSTGAFTTVTASVAISGSRASGAYSYGTLDYSDTGLFTSYASSVSGYAQEILRNTSAAATASVDYVVSNNLGTATTYYGDFGMNSSGFTGTGSLNLANAVYVSSTSGDLVLGTTTSNPIHFVVNSGSTDAMIVQASGGVGIGTATDPGANNLAVGGTLSYSNDAPGINTITSAGTTTTLTATSTFYQRVTGSANQTIKLPNQTTVLAGTAYVIDSDTSGTVTVQDSAGTTLATVPQGMAGYIYSMSNSAATGNWGGYAFVPGASATGPISWGTAGLSLAGSYIQGITTLGINGSSTGTTTVQSANAGASNFTITLPAATGTVPLLSLSQTWTGTQTFNGTLAGTAFASPPAIGGTAAAAGTFTTLGASTTTGYATGLGAGGTVTQGTSRTTGVTLNKATGQITLFSTTTTAGQTTTFTVTNSTVAATDVIQVSQSSGTGIYFCTAKAAAGSFNLSVYTPAAVGSGEAPVLNFVVIKGSAN